MELPGEILRAGIKGDVGWNVASHGLFSCFELRILAYLPAFGIASWPAILLLVSLLGLLSCFGPRILACFLASGLAKLHPFLSCASLCGSNAIIVDLAFRFTQPPLSFYQTSPSFYPTSPFV